MIDLRRVGVVAPLLCLALSACGSGLPDARSAVKGNAATTIDSANSDCAKFCQNLPPGPLRGACASDAAQGGGVCAACGGNVGLLCGLGPTGGQPGPTDLQP